MPPRRRLTPSAPTSATNSAQQTAERVARFAPPQVLEGESAADFKDLLARICAAVTPVDVIEEMFVANLASLQWEFLRWQRLSWSWIRTRQHEALRGFLATQLDDELCAEHLADHLAEFLQNKLPEGQAELLAEKYVQNEAIAVDKVNEILVRSRLDIDAILNPARRAKAEELVQEYVRHERGAVTLIDELLTRAGVNIDALTADALKGDELATPIDFIEQIERLATVAQSRLHACLREIEQRRAVFGATLRRSVQEIEDSERKVIDIRPAKGTKVG
jgi:hypothetical protein